MPTTSKRSLDPRLVQIVQLDAKWIRPPPERTAAEWADVNRSFPPGTAEPGPHRSDRAPYMIAIAQAAVTYLRIVVVCGSQMSKTTLVLNLAGRKLDDDPAPVLYIGPTKSNIDSVIEPQFRTMIRTTPSLAVKQEPGKQPKHVKRIAGVTLRLAWAGSATELASQPAHTILVDEVDRMEPIPGEGDPVSLADARKDTYPDGLLAITSTPTEGSVEVEKHPETGFEHWKLTDPELLASPVWKFFQEGTRFEWAVPCPECHGYFIPRMSLLFIPKECSPKRALKEARLICARCGVHIEDKHRHAMNARGVFVAPGQSVVDGVVVGDPPESDTASFWVSGLMSAWRTWGQRAAAWVRALKSGDQNRIRTVTNTAFGELFAYRGDAPSHDEVRACAGDYRFDDVPEGVRIISCFVDVQKRRLIYAVRGWGVSMESWLLEADEIHGETEEDAPWFELAELLEKRYGEKRIRRMFVDSGYRPGEKWRKPDNQIYRFCRRFRGLAFPSKGRDRLLKPLQPSRIDVTLDGKTYPKGLTLWNIDTDVVKSWVHGRLAWPAGRPGRWWVPENVTEDYCQQVVAEARTLKPSGHAVWVRIRRENHYFDCEAGNVAIAMSLGVHRRLIRPPRQEEKAVVAGATPVDVPLDQQQQQRRTFRRPRRGWVTHW